MKKFSRIAALVMAMLMLMATFAVSVGAAKFYEAGDANTDDVINIKDATIIQKYAAELADIGDAYAADVNCDDVVNVKDATAVQKYVAGIGDTIEEAAGVDFSNVVLPTEPAKGADTAADEFMYKETENGTIKIIAYIGESKSITIPEKIDGKTVEIIGKCAFSPALDISKLNETVPADLESVWIPDTVTVIEEGIVAYQKNLTALRLPAGMTEIPAYTALECVSLKDFVLPQSTEKIGFAAFQDCRKMTSYTLPESCTAIDAQAFTRNDRLVYINLDKVETIGKWAFFECNNLTSVMDLSAIKTLDTSAFQACRSLKEVTLGAELKAIPDSCFKNCYKLISVDMPEGVTSIDKLAFGACYKIQNCDVPTSCTVADNAFEESVWARLDV